MTDLLNKVPNLITSLTGPLSELERHLLDKQPIIEAWFREKWPQTPPPFYGSVDLRCAGFKVAPVDTNLFPAGFNNLNPDFMPLCVQAVQSTMAEICASATNVLLVPESHSRNPFYFKNLFSLAKIIAKAGFVVRIGSLDPEITEPKTIELDDGQSLVLEPLVRQGGRVGLADFDPCVIILNNDLSLGVPDMLKDVEQPILPSVKLGWYNRLKSEHFGFYQEICEEFAEKIDLDPWLISPYFSHDDQVDFMDRKGMESLQQKSAQLLEKIQKKYQQYGIQQTPFLVAKADRGTYGMAVMTLQDPDELLQLNRRKRSHMSTRKGNQQVQKVIVQEGVHSFETFGADDAVAEPVVYLIGRHVVGGFYRVHNGRGPNENLNSPGMNFSPLSFNEPCNVPSTSQNPVNRFYMYGVIARLAFLAAAKELAVFRELPND